MKKLVTVLVIDSFSFAGRDYKPGDTVTCRPVEAIRFKRQGLVKFSGLKNRVVIPEPEPEPEPTRRRRGAYRRRDMTPEAA